MAHHDVYPNSYGFNDNSTGVVTLLRLQRAVHDNVELVFTDGEECGGQGCRYYLENYPKPKEAINVDVVGLGNKIFYEMYGDCSFVMPPHTTMYQGVPFSDSYVLADYGVPNILLLTGKHRSTLIEDIFHAEHCGKDDGKLDLISENIMNAVSDVLLGMV
jgi:Zn-dependent M28 family amino/carboxypeptidase